MVVGITMPSLSIRLPGIPDVFYGMRVRKLVEDGVLGSQGNLARMRLSEVRFARTTRYDNENVNYIFTPRYEVSLLAACSKISDLEIFPVEWR